MTFVQVVCWGDNSTGGKSWGDHSIGGISWGDNSIGGSVRVTILQVIPCFETKFPVGINI